ncbi:MAG: hypothetical protein AAB974_04040 [Patescibacteria group bacterium]
MDMLHSAFFAGLRKRYAGYDAERRETIKLSSDVLTDAKQAIFAFHRGDLAGGEQLLVHAERLLGLLAKRFKRTVGLSDEGSYRAALEEYAEARLFLDFLKGKRIGAVDAPAIDEDAYLGGVMDFTGEAVRYAIKAATNGDMKEVRRAHVTVEEVAQELIKMNITGHLRNKFDQLKINLRKLEEIQYDLSLR